MHLSSSLKRWFTDTVLHSAFTGQDAYGAPTYAAAVSRKSFWEQHVRRIVDHAGQERVTRHRVFLDGTVPLDIRDRLVLPDGTTSPILLVGGPRDPRGGVHHRVVYF